jgi:hypothetical protein
MPIRLVALTQATRKKPESSVPCSCLVGRDAAPLEPDMEEIMAIMKEEIEAWEDEITLTRWQRFKAWIKDRLHVS